MPTDAIPKVPRGQIWARQLAAYQGRLDGPLPMVVEGKLTRMVGMTLEAVGCQAAIGSRCVVAGPGGTDIETEVVGFAGESLYLMPIGDLHGLIPDARVIPVNRVQLAPVGEALLGRVVDGAGLPLDGLGPLNPEARAPLTGRSI
ncbi:MAG: flagellum-specific ATP synthase FliI, partial [Gammaproteobacteria bacterium]